ncbi:MAG: NAD-dependent epimerase/dehydratase family protein [Natronospirillum sp.]|uniref:NAD-dependent epimerase/dehydratase family protein n=1 Tax=Natronospirillum sp. TaxID=2812955 RepID=UPI0025FC2F6E|nr:NAD-dependent epimerase/dehydratase family protein [Natronospirillum sp.]MCH8552185.1 NAD-dependent epimerase/dehydratase family protein [Natronospirillum sp.]
MAEPKTSALLMGATGLVGSAALPLLAQAFDTVWTPGRRLPSNAPGNSHFVETDYSDLSPLNKAIAEPPEVVCIAFGTTIKQAGSQERFATVDRDYPLALARWALGRGAQRLCLISAVGADVQSRVFYNRIKGELEQALRDMPWQSLHILRPSLLLGPHANRPLETLGQVVMGPMAPLLPARIRPIKATQLAGTMVACARDHEAKGVQVLEGRPLFEEKGRS